MTGATLIGGCSSQPSPDDFRQAAVNSVTEKCGAPRDVAKLNGGWVFVIEKEEDAVRSCVIAELRRTGKKHISIIANQLYPNEQGK